MSIPRFRKPISAGHPAEGFSGPAVLAVVAIAVFLSGPGQTYGVSVFVDPLIEETGFSRSMVASLYSGATLVSGFGILLVGRLIDRRGNRVIMAFSTVAFAVGLLTASVVTTPLVLFIGFAMLRLFGSASLTLSGRTVIPNWYIRRRGWAFSIVGVAASLSLALIPLFGRGLIGLFDWRVAWRIQAILLVAILLPLILVIVRDRPEDVGQFPDGGKTEPQGTPEPIEFESRHAWTLSEAIRTRSFWLLLFAGIVPSLVVTGLSFNQVSIFAAAGLPSSLAATTFTIESAIALPTTLASGWLTGRIPSRYVLAGSQGFLALALVILFFSDSVVLVVLFALARGASSGLWAVAADVLWPNYFGRRNLGSIRSATFAASVFGASAGPLPFGIAYDMFGSYRGAIAVMLLLPIAGFAAVLMARAPQPPSES
ncbi:MAG: MFS transporter [Thermomicrobiales bacterium]